MEPLDPDGNRVVDMETGDIYSWDDSQGMYLLEEPEKEIVTEYVGIQVNQDNSELSDVQDSVSDLEVQVEELEEELELLSDYDASPDHNLGTSNLSIFQGLVSKVPFGEHYVYWRDGQYSYKFAYGDLSWDGSEFTGADEITICTYVANTTGYQADYYWQVSYDLSFSLDPGDRLVYSDLGDFPGLGEREVQKYVAITAYTCFGVMLFGLFDRLRRACFRR